MEVEERVGVGEGKSDGDDGEAEEGLLLLDGFSVCRGWCVPVRASSLAAPT